MIDLVDSLIDAEEIVDLALSLGNIPSPPGKEKEVSDYLFDWTRSQGFSVKRISLLPDRSAIVATHEGTGGGYTLAFNAHMDTAESPDAIWASRDPNKKILHSAWVEGDRIIGDGVVNDKGCMAAFLVAAKAIRRSGVPLPGDLVLMMVPGEIGIEPVDEFHAPDFLSKEVGTRYTITHGAVADCAIVAERTNLKMVWVEAGKAFFKLTVFGEPGVYTPYLNRPTELVNSPNAIVRSAAVIAEIERWALEYEKVNTLVCKGGTVTPKVNIGAIRGGYPYKVIESSEVCSIYLDVRTRPGQDPLAIRNELRALLDRVGTQGEVELFLYRPGYEGQNMERLVQAVESAHSNVVGSKPEVGRSPISSMWRDSNVFSELGIPAMTYGPGGPRAATTDDPPVRTMEIRIDDLLQGAKIYAQIALSICGARKRFD